MKLKNTIALSLPKAKIEELSTLLGRPVVKADNLLEVKFYLEDVARESLFKQGDYSLVKKEIKMLKFIDSFLCKLDTKEKANPESKNVYLGIFPF